MACQRVSAIRVAVWGVLQWYDFSMGLPVGILSGNSFLRVLAVVETTCWRRLAAEFSDPKAGNRMLRSRN